MFAANERRVVYMDYKKLVIDIVQNINSEYLLKILYRFVNGLVD